VFSLQKIHFVSWLVPWMYSKYDNRIFNENRIFIHACLKKVPCFSSLYVSMCILSREDMWCIVIICSITAQLNSEVIHSEPFDWTKIYVQQDLIHLMLFYFWYSVYVVSLPKEANSAQCLCLQHTVSWYGNQKWKFLPYKNKRVNYTPLPSKMLEIHSPPLLC